MSMSSITNIYPSGQRRLHDFGIGEGGDSLCPCEPSVSRVFEDVMVVRETWGHNEMVLVSAEELKSMGLVYNNDEQRLEQI